MATSKNVNNYRKTAVYTAEPTWRGYCTNRKNEHRAAKVGWQNVGNINNTAINPQSLNDETSSSVNLFVEQNKLRLLADGQQSTDHISRNTGNAASFSLQEKFADQQTDQQHDDYQYQNCDHRRRVSEDARYVRRVGTIFRRHGIASVQSSTHPNSFALVQMHQHFRRFLCEEKWHGCQSFGWHSNWVVDDGVTKIMISKSSTYPTLNLLRVIWMTAHQPHSCDGSWSLGSECLTPHMWISNTMLINLLFSIRLYAKNENHYKMHTVGWVLMAHLLPEKLQFVSSWRHIDTKL